MNIWGGPLPFFLELLSIEDASSFCYMADFLRWMWRAAVALRKKLNLDSSHFTVLVNKLLEYILTDIQT